MKTYRVRMHITEDTYIEASNKKMALLIYDETHNQHKTERRVKKTTITRMTDETGPP